MVAAADEAMPDQPWYHDFFGPAFWALVEQEYTDDRTAAEVGYLAATLSRHAPGSRVLDLGCGSGRLARGLADHGFAVTAVDVASAAVSSAQPHPGVEFFTADLLAADPWPGGPFDSAILVQGLGWGSDAEQRRFLARLHEVLAPGGVLVLDVSTAAWILRNFEGHGEAVTPAGRFVLERHYDALTGRVGGAMTHHAGDGSSVRLRQSVRLYLVEQALALATESGFEVISVDADFVSGAAVDMNTRYAQLVCRAAPRPPNTLALSQRTSSRGDELDLHWSPDEAGFLKPSPLELWKQWWPTDATEQLRISGTYDFDDPYGGGRAAPVLSLLHGVPLQPGQVTFGAGVTGLLATVSGLSERGPVAVGRYGHRDAAAWAAASGSPIIVTDDPLEVQLPDGAGSVTMVVLDRPNAVGQQSDAEVELFARGRRLADRGAVLVIDESYANYLGPHASAIALVNRLPNVVVLRGVAKGYCLGGLRSGWAVCSPELADRLRTRTVPLAISAVSVRFTLELLAAGDVFGPLRHRLAEVRDDVRTAFERVGVATEASTSGLPWLTAVDAAQAINRLGGLGISYKRLDPADGLGAPVVRLAVPLSAERVDRLMRITSGGVR